MAPVPSLFSDQQPVDVHSATDTSAVDGGLLDGADDLTELIDDGTGPLVPRIEIPSVTDSTDDGEDGDGGDGENDDELVDIDDPGELVDELIFDMLSSDLTDPVDDLARDILDTLPDEVIPSEVIDQVADVVEALPEIPEPVVEVVHAVEEAVPELPEVPDRGGGRTGRNGDRSDRESGRSRRRPSRRTGLSRTIWALVGPIPWCTKSYTAAVKVLVRQTFEFLRLDRPGDMAVRFVVCCDRGPGTAPRHFYEKGALLVNNTGAALSDRLAPRPSQISGTRWPQASCDSQSIG